MTHKIWYSILEAPLQRRLINQALSKLPPEEAIKINRLQRWQDRDTTILGKLMLQNVLLEFGYDTELLSTLQYSLYGKPHLDAKIWFNISHSDLLTVLVVSAQGDLGIDAEKYEPQQIEDFTSFFTDLEMHEIRTAQDSMLRFYQLWTRKEAFLKAIGMGLLLPPAQIDARNQIYWNDTIWFLHHIPLPQGYICHLATVIQYPTIEIKRYKQD